MIVKHFRKRHAAAALSTCITLRCNWNTRQKQVTTTSYCKAATNLLKTYVTDDATSESSTDMKDFSQPPNSYLRTTPKFYSMRCFDATDYIENTYSKVFIEVVLESFCRSIRS